ncbi:MAG: hypothetical protein ACPHLK_03295 [Gammaproteobacteria bacterium]|jgi:hypothetical protein
MYKFDNEEEEQAETSQSSMSSFNETSKDVLSVVVRLCGLILLFIGLWIAIQVFNEALALYKDPSNIERMASAIEAGSNIDKSIAPIHESILGEDEVSSDVETTVKVKENTEGFRISYFIAWIVDLLLLLLLARISFMAIKTGGELALYDAQIKKFARQLLKANKE